MCLRVLLHNETGVNTVCCMWKSKIKDGGHKPEVDLEQQLCRLVEMMKANFQWLYSCVLGPATQWSWLQYCTL